jgi:hypothetical protein
VWGVKRPLPLEKNDGAIQFPEIGLFYNVFRFEKIIPGKFFGHFARFHTRWEKQSTRGRRPLREAPATPTTPRPFRAPNTHSGTRRPTPGTRRPLHAAILSSVVQRRIPGYWATSTEYRSFTIASILLIGDAGHLPSI